MARGPQPPDARSQAEKALKAATTRKAELPAEMPAVPGARA